jgi:hypothetical protein
VFSFAAASVCRKRRVDVAVDDYEFRSRLFEQLFERDEDVCGLSWLPDPTPRFTSGSGSPSSVRISADIFGS